VSDISLMAISAGSEPGIPPHILIEQDGVWQDTPPIAAGPLVNLETLRDRLNLIVSQTITRAIVSEQAKEAMRAQGMALYQMILPQPVADLLTAKRQEGPAAPVLRIHVHEQYDWIPWEILHDGVDFLGLSFMVARVPIVATPPDTSHRTSHPVRSVRSLLAENVLDPAEFAAWERTFDDIVTPPVTEHRIPAAAGGGWPGLEQISEAKADDIFHVTCHGGLKDEQTGDFYWLINDTMSFSFLQVTPTFVRGLDFSEKNPLVFGNACASATTESENRLSPGLATTFFSRGALNFVGTFAPITKELALEFPRKFYKRLLGDGDAPVAEALWATKKEYAEANTPDLSYLFYCLYGPPDTVFRLTAADDAEVEQVVVGDRPGP
jgi:CHAT domain-containing protein